MKKLLNKLRAIRKQMIVGKTFYEGSPYIYKVEMLDQIIEIVKKEIKNGNI